VIHVGAVVVIQCKIKAKCSAFHIDTQILPIDYATLVHCNIRIFFCIITSCNLSFKQLWDRFFQQLFPLLIL
jgi:hypothetical protein